MLLRRSKQTAFSGCWSSLLSLLSGSPRHGSVWVEPHQLLTGVNAVNAQNFKFVTFTNVLPSSFASTTWTRSFASASVPTQTSQPPTHKEISVPQDFTEIVTLSKSVPVIIDAYAVWCGPCKQLDPVLKKAVEKQRGKIMLAKMDIDSPSLAPLMQQLQIASVPTLFLLIGGRIVDVKTGVPPPSELNEWISKAVQLAQAVQQAAMGKQSESEGGTDPKEMVRQGFEAMKGSSPLEMVAPKFAGVVQNPDIDAPTKAEATAGLAYCAIKEGDISTGRDLLQNARSLLKPDEPVPEKVEMVGAILDLVEEGGARDMGIGTLDDGFLEQLRETVRLNPNDLDARYDLALGLWICDQREDAIDEALRLVRVDKQWNDQAGRQLVLRMASAFGNSSEEGKSARKRLSNLWFI